MINNLKILNGIDRLTHHVAKSEMVKIQIVWWPAINNTGDVQWSVAPPHCREVTCEVLGVWSARRVKFIVHAVLPNESLPPMNRPSRPLFIKAIRKAMSIKLGVGIEGCNADVIDWEGSDAE